MGNCFGIRAKKSYNEPLLSASDIRFHQEDTRPSLDYNNIPNKIPNQNTEITYNIKWIDSEINNINDVVIPNLLSSKCELSEIKVRVTLIEERLKNIYSDIENLNDKFLAQSINSSIFNKRDDITLLRKYYDDIHKRYTIVHKVIYSIENGKNLADAANS